MPVTFPHTPTSASLRQLHEQIVQFKDRVVAARSCRLSLAEVEQLKHLDQDIAAKCAIFGIQLPNPINPPIPRVILSALQVEYQPIRERKGELYWLVHYEGTPWTDLMAGFARQLELLAELTAEAERTVDREFVPAGAKGEDGSGSPPKEQSSDIASDKLPTAILKAMRQSWGAIQRSQESDKLLTAESSGPEVYDWLKEEGEETLLKRDTWLKYQQRGRKLLGQPKSSPLGGRPKGRTIVNQDEIEAPEAD
jgi:hypothetical protein